MKRVEANRNTLGIATRTNFIVYCDLIVDPALSLRKLTNHSASSKRAQY